MVDLTRRRFLQTSGITLAVGSAGCLRNVPIVGGPKEYDVGLQLWNFFDESRTVSVTADGVDSEDSYRDEFEVAVNGHVIRETILPAGWYHVTVVIGDDRESEELYWGDCPSDKIHVEFGRGGISISKACHH